MSVLHLALGEKSYDITVERGALARAAGLLPGMVTAATSGASPLRRMAALCSDNHIYHASHTARVSSVPYRPASAQHRDRLTRYLPVSPMGLVCRNTVSPAKAANRLGTVRVHTTLSAFDWAI